MARDQNTFAKRQREIEQKRKANEKRERRADKKRPDHSSSTSSNQPTSALTKAEYNVLSIFRKYMINQGQMFCFHGPEFANYRLPLTLLTRKGLLIAENSTGGFSLTATGFAESKNCG